MGSLRTIELAMQDDPAPMPSTELALIQLAASAREQGYRFVTPTPCTHERVNKRPANQWATDLRGVLGWNRPFLPNVISPLQYELMQRAQLLEPVGDGWRSRLRLSTLNQRMYWHSGYPTTDSNAVFFGPDTYRFVQAIQHYLHRRKRPVKRAFDMGCGAGPGALEIARACSDAQVWAGDINDTALRMATLNAKAANATNLHTCRSHLLDGVDGFFDLIVANPPYLNDPRKRTYRHGGGSHGQGLAVRMLAAALARLAPGGTLLLYTGTAIINGHDVFLEDAQPVLDASPHVSWHYRELDPDVFGEELETPAYEDAERIAAVLLQATLS